MENTDDKQDPPRFELVLQPKDADGKPLGPPKTFTADSGFNLWRHFMNNQSKPGKKKKAKEAKLPAKAEANIILQEVANYAERKQEAKEVNDTNK